MSLVDKIREFAERGGDWERKKTSIPGVFLIKLPARRGVGEVAVEINPVDGSGQRKKRRGLILRGLEDYWDFKRILNDSKLEALIKAVSEVNPRRGPAEEGEEELEI